MPPFMGQGMCAGIRDVSNLAWKISKCLRSKHSEKLLKTYQSERFSNVKEYIETTMRMGEFVNAVENIKITKNISSLNDGTKSMQSIKPKIGFGLGEKKDKKRGEIFPQFKLKTGKNLDDKFSKISLLLCSSKIKKNISNKLNSLESVYVNDIKGWVKYLPPKSQNAGSFNCNKVIHVNYDEKGSNELLKIDNTIAIKQFLPDAWIASNKKHAKKFITWIINTDFYSLHYNDNQKAIKLINKLI